MITTIPPIILEKSPFEKNQAAAGTKTKPTETKHTKNIPTVIKEKHAAATNKLTNNINC